MPYSSRLEILVDSRGAERDMVRFESRLERVERAGNQVAGSMDRTSSSIGSMRGSSLLATSALAGLTGALSAGQVIRYADAWTNTTNQIRQVTSSSEQLLDVQQKLVQVAIDTRANYESTANLYSRLTRSTTALGLSQQELLNLTTTINQSFAVSGATADEAANAITQLSQGLAAGALRGDELNSVMEQAEGITIALTESLNMSRGELREFAAQGGVTSEIIVRALQQAADTIDNDFGDSVASFGQKLEIANTRIIEWVGTSETVSGAVGILGDGILELTDNIDLLVDAGIGIAAIYGARLTASLASSAAGVYNNIRATQAHTIALAENQAMEAGRAATMARTTAAEQAAAAQRASIAAQRAAQDRAAIAQDAQRLASTQAALAAERALETQRLQAQISATGRQQSIARLAELRSSETAVTNQLTAANQRLTQAEAAEASAKRAATLASVEKTRADAAATAAMGTYTTAATAATRANGLLAASGRVAAGAMALVGGPVGAAVIAGAGLYYFREELGLTDAKMQGTVDNIEELGSAFIEEFGNLGAEIVGAFRGMRAELVELDAGFLDMKAGALESFTDIIAGSADLINMGLIPIQNVLNALDQGFADWINRFANAFESAGEMPFGMANLFGEQVSRMRSMADGLTEGMIEPIGISTTALESNAQAWREQAEAMRGSAENIRNGVNPAASAALDIFKPLSEWLFETNDALNEPVDSEAAKAAKKLADEFESLKRTLDPSYSSLMDFWEGIELLNEAIDTSTIEGMTEYNRLVGLLTERYAEATKGSDDAKKALEQLTQQYDSQYQRGVALTQAISDINAAYRRGDIEGQQYGRMIQGVRDEMRELALEADPMAQEMARAWEEATNRIDETFSDAFAGAFDSFDSFADQLLDGFKRLLAELAYQATLKPIVVGFTGDMRSIMSGGGGGFGNTIGAARSLFSSGSSVLGGGSTVAAAGGLYSGASTGLAAGGLYGNAVTGGIASTGIMSSITAGVSAAMPWIAGGLAIDSLLGGGISKAISGLFGDETTPRLNISTRAGMGDYSHESVSMGGFGAVGFSEGTRRSNDLFGSVEAEREWLASVAALDNMTAAAARTPEQLDAMTAAVQSMVITSEDAQGAIDQLAGRTAAATRVIDEELTQTLLDAGASAEEIAQRFATARNAVDLITAASERLNLQFDANAAGAMRAADGMAQLMGGADNLNASLGSFYDTFYTEEEKLQHLTEDLSSTFASMGRELPTTREGVRELVEGLELMGTAGQEQLATILQTTPALREYITAMEAQNNVVNDSAAIAEERWRLENELLEAQGRDAELLARTRERELSSIDESNRALQERIWMFEDEQAAQDAAIAAQEAAQQRADLLNRTSLYSSGIVGGVDDALDAYNEQMQLASEVAQQREQQLRDEMDAVQQLGNLLDSLMLSNQSILDPAERLQEAQRQFAELSVRAENGDTAAAGQLDGASSAYLDAAAAYYGQSSGQYANIFNDVTGSIGDLEDRFGESIATLGSIEDIENQLLREQQRVRGTLSSSLGQHVQQSTLLGSIADLIELLPESLGSAIADAIPRSSSSSGGSTGGSNGGFDEAAYLANKTEQVNSIGFQGRTDWTPEQVLDAINRDYGSVENHYDEIGRSEGVTPYFDGSHANGLWNVPFDGYVAELHKGEMVAPAGTASRLRELPNRALPTPELPPMPMQSQSNPSANNEALLRAFAGMRDDNRRLLDRVGQLESQLAAIAGNTGAIVEPARRTAEATEKAERNSRTRKRNPA